MASYRQNELAVIVNGTAKQQSAFGVPLLAADLNTLLALKTRNVPQLAEVAQRLLDCYGRNTVDERIVSRSATWPLELVPTPRALAIFFALALGEVDAPAGAQANEVQTITIDATGGTFIVQMVFEGVTYRSAPIAWNASAVTVAAALNKMFEGFGATTVAVGKVGLVYTITFQNALGFAPMALMTTIVTGLTGGAGTAAAARTTAGSNYEHVMHESDSYQGPPTTMAYGFHRSSAQASLFFDAVVRSLGFTGTRGEQEMGASVSMFGSGNFPPIGAGYVYPTCANQFGIRPGDMRVKIGASWIGKDLQSLGFNYDLGILEQDAILFDSIDIQRAERADQIQRGLTLSLDGEPGDANYEKGRARDHDSVKIVLGVPRERIIVDIPSALFKLQSPAVGFDGQASRSTVKLNAVPDASLGGDIITVTYHGDLATQMLQVAV